MKISNLTFGTAQLGLDYGIANITGKPDFQLAIKMLNYAWENGINSFDTAPSYGNSEEIIGSFISSKNRKDNEDVVVISKLPRIEMKNEFSFNILYNHIKKRVLQSIRNLKINTIPIYLLHHPEDIYLKNGLAIECLNQIKEEGLIGNLGISLYDPKEVEFSLNFKEIDVIQAPINLFDHRLIKTGLLKKLKKSNIKIFARSVYLQGLFFKHLSDLPQDLKTAEKPLKELHNIIESYQLDINELAVLFVRDIPEVSSIVIGAEKIDQVKKNIEILNKKPLNEDIREEILELFAEMPQKVIDPRLWKI